MGHANAAGSRFCSECGVSLEPAVNPPSRSRTPPPSEVGPQHPPANASPADARARRSSVWAEWWEGTNRGLGRMGLAVTLSSLSIPGIFRSLADQHGALTITDAIVTTLPLTAAAAIIAYCAHREISLSPIDLVGIFVSTAFATAVLGIGGGGQVRDVFFSVPHGPDACFKDLFGAQKCLPGQEDFSQRLPGLIVSSVRLVKLYWQLWGPSGLISAAAVGWFLGWFWARRVIGVLGPRPSAASGEQGSRP